MITQSSFSSRSRFTLPGGRPGPPSRVRFRFLPDCFFFGAAGGAGAIRFGDLGFRIGAFLRFPVAKDHPCDTAINVLIVNTDCSHNHYELID